MKKNKKKLLSFKYFTFDFLRIFGCLPGFIMWRPKYMYENENARKKIKGGGIVISNHLGFVDPVYIMYGLWYRRMHFVALRILFEGKFKNWLFRQFLCIPIDRENLNMDTFREIITCLNNDELVAIFPEGKINVEKTGIQTFKSGMIMMALRSKKPIYPIYIEKKKGLFGRLTIVAGEKITLPEGNMNLSAIEDITKQLYNKELLLKKIAQGES